MTHNFLYYGDNLEILRNKIRDETVDLSYIDPPFNSKRSYFQIYNRIGEEDLAQAQAFVDTWLWEDRASDGYDEITANKEGRFTRQTIELITGLQNVLGKDSLLAYLVSMTIRINEIQRVLKSTGSFYLHCDPTASHYLKLVLDSVFCPRGGNFINEIVWCYSTGGRAKEFYPHKHDIIFLYTKGKDYLFKYDDIALPRDTSTMHEPIRYDSKGKPYQRNFKNGKEYKYYLDKGVLPNDWWTDIQALNPAEKERLGYPTQKPEVLLERVVKASSNVGDVVLDAYSGCGTTVIAAERNKRKWIGIDITYQSISLILKRLEDTFTAKALSNVAIDGIPQDMDSAIALAHKQDDRLHKEFEKWAVLTYSNNRAAINAKKGADKGIDGIAYFISKFGADPERIVFQVKSGGVNRGDIAKLDHDRQREQSQVGILITLEDPSKPMLREARTAGTYLHEQMQKKFDRIQIVTIKEMIEQGKRIEIPLNYRPTKSATAIVTQGDSGQLTFDDTMES